jgi:hypothetical protein
MKLMACNAAAEAANLTGKILFKSKKPTLLSNVKKPQLKRRILTANSARQVMTSEGKLEG